MAHHRFAPAAIACAAGGVPDATLAGMRRIPWRRVVAGLVGGATGYAYYHFFGCDSG